jgi:polysaccharide export outer membrane protein
VFYPNDTEEGIKMPSIYHPNSSVRYISVSFKKLVMRLMGRMVLSLTWLLPIAQQCWTAPQESTFAADSKNEAHREQDVLGYVLGPGDQIAVHVVNVEEISDKPIPVELNGYVRLPLIGSIRVSGLTIAQVEVIVADRLRTYILHPDVSINIAEFRSQPVSVIGAVKSPGIQQVQGRKTLLEMLSLSGGLDAAAGSTVKVTRGLQRGRIPLAHVADDQTKQFSVAEVSLKSLLNAKNPEENILIEPYDVISVPRADVVYVIGEVHKAGGFPLDNAEEATVLQALSMAGGLDQMAQPQNAKILRRVPGVASRTEIGVHLKKILDGRASDVPMQAEDILFIPSSMPKKATLRALEAGLQMGTGLVIWRR